MLEVAQPCCASRMSCIWLLQGLLYARWVGGWVSSRVEIQVVNGALGLPMPQKATLSFSRQLRRGQG